MTGEFTKCPDAPEWMAESADQAEWVQLWQNAQSPKSSKRIAASEKFFDGLLPKDHPPSKTPKKDNQFYIHVKTMTASFRQWPRNPFICRVGEPKWDLGGDPLILKVYEAVVAGVRKLAYDFNAPRFWSLERYNTDDYFEFWFEIKEHVKLDLDGAVLTKTSTDEVSSTWVYFVNVKSGERDYNCLVKMIKYNEESAGKLDRDTTLLFRHHMPLQILATQYLADPKASRSDCLYFVRQLALELRERHEQREAAGAAGAAE